MTAVGLLSKRKSAPRMSARPSRKLIRVHGRSGHRGVAARATVGREFVLGHGIAIKKKMRLDIDLADVTLDPATVQARRSKPRTVSPPAAPQVVEVAQLRDLEAHCFQKGIR